MRRGIELRLVLEVESLSRDGVEGEVEGESYENVDHRGITRGGPEYTCGVPMDCYRLW